MGCKNIERRIVDYFEEKLSETEKKDLFAEIEKCEHCRKLFENFKAGMEAVNIINNSEGQINFKANHEKIWDKMQKKNIVPTPLLKLVFVNAVLLLFFIGAFLFFQLHGSKNKIENINYSILQNVSYEEIISLYNSAEILVTPYDVICLLDDNKINELIYEYVCDEKDCGDEEDLEERYEGFYSLYE